jgi:hypothetical protein
VCFVSYTFRQVYLKLHRAICLLQKLSSMNVVFSVTAVLGVFTRVLVDRGREEWYACRIFNS